ncbi:MAG: hypothetical protein QMC93_01240 [Patescibacteria group bacterium]|nr:hypothetical protein [Patescibacteria group bacterium]
MEEEQNTDKFREEPELPSQEPKSEEEPKEEPKPTEEPKKEFFEEKEEKDYLEKFKQRFKPVQKPTGFLAKILETKKWWRRPVEKEKEPNTEKELKPEPKKDFFEGKKYLKVSEIRQKFLKASPKIPGSGRLLGREERKALPEELFGKQQFVNPQKVKEALKKFERASYGQPTKEKMEAKRKIRWLKREMGKL